MPQPSAALAVQRNDLSAAFEEFDLERNMQSFIAQRVLPVTDVARQTGQFPIIPIEQLLQNRDTERAPGTGYSRGTFKFEMSDYSVPEHGAEEPLDDVEAAMYRELIEAEMYAALRARSVLMTNAEKRAAALLFNAGTWTGSALTTAVQNEWDKASTATPIVDVEAAVRKVYEGSGLWPNALIISRIVFRNLRNCDEIIDRVKSQGFMDVRAGEINESHLASVFDLPYIIVGGGTKNNAAQGLAVSPAQIWSSEYAMVAKIATSGDIKEPCIGRSLHWSADGSIYDGTTDQYREEKIRSEIYRVRHHLREKVLYPQAGHLLSNITT